MQMALTSLPLQQEMHCEMQKLARQDYAASVSSKIRDVTNGFWRGVLVNKFSKCFTEFYYDNYRFPPSYGSFFVSTHFYWAGIVVVGQALRYELN